MKLFHKHSWTIKKIARMGYRDTYSGSPNTNEFTRVWYACECDRVKIKEYLNKLTDDEVRDLWPRP